MAAIVVCSLADRSMQSTRMHACVSHGALCRRGGVCPPFLISSLQASVEAVAPDLRGQGRAHAALMALSCSL